MCRIASLFLLQRLKGRMSGDACDFNNIETRAVIEFFFPPARQGAEGNSRHSDRNIRGTCTIVRHRQKLGGGITLCESAIRTRGMSKLSSDRLNFARKGHETVARAHSYFANIPEGVRHVLIAAASSSSKLELLKYGKAH